MDLLMQQWVKHCSTDNVASCYFCGSIGVVYSGMKPAEIINVSSEKLNQCVLLKEHVKFIVLGKKNAKYKLFIYNPEKLEETLNRKNVLNHLRKLGYSKTFSLNDYVSTLILRLKHSEGFPHEIGFFLGYPVKDVLSFMGLIDLPLVKTMGWRMYGNTIISEDLYYQVKKAKDEIINYAKQTQKKVC
jgi:hypothetical protein